jgi:hypothetical protein
MKKEDVLEIISQTYLEDYKSLAIALVGYNYDDLLNHTFLEIAKLSEDKLIGLFERRELRFFILRMFQNQGRSISSSYYKENESFKTSGISENHIGEVEVYDPVLDRKAEAVRIHLLTFANWFDKDIAQQHLNQGTTIAKISERYGVNSSFVFQTLKRIKESCRRVLEYPYLTKQEILDEYDILCELYEKGKATSNGRINIHLRQRLLDFYKYNQMPCLINNVHSRSVMEEVYGYYV